MQLRANFHFSTSCIFVCSCIVVIILQPCLAWQTDAGFSHPHLQRSASHVRKLHAN